MEFGGWEWVPVWGVAEVDVLDPGLGIWEG